MKTIPTLIIVVALEGQLGQRLPEKVLEQIVQFLKTLTGEYGGKPL